MPETPRIVIGTFADIPILGVKESGWASTAGVQPYIGTFEVRREDIPNLMAIGGAGFPRRLTVGSNAYEFIFIVNQRPAENPHLGVIVLADRRFWWKYIFIAKRYNIRRKVGTKRRGKWDDVLQEDVVPEVRYASFSLDGDKPWTPKRLLEDFFSGEDGLNIAAGQFTVDADVDKLEKMPVDDVPLNDPGDKAAARVLTAIPGMDVTVDHDGRVRVFSTVSGKEKAIVGEGKILEHGSIGPEIVGGGHIEIISNELVNPQAVDVYFAIEQELRFNFKSDASTVGQTIAEQDVDFILENVAPIPDFDITVAGKKQYFGTFLPIEDLLRAWTDNLPATALIARVTAEMLDKAMVPGVDFWGALDLLGSLDADAARANWSARIAALKQHYLQTFRIHSEWMDRILQIKPELVATLDIVSGQRARATAFSDHALLPSRKALLAAARGTSDRFFCVNVSGYPGDNTEITDAIRPSPARVQVLDSDQGIVRVAYHTDAFQFLDAVLPAKVLDSASAGTRPAKFSMRKSDSHYPPASNAIAFTGGAVARLDPRKRVAIVLTAIPAAPNSKEQYYRIRVTPADVGAIFSGLPAVAAGLAKARGPIQQVFIGPGLEVARSRWQQSEIETIKRIFGMGGNLGDVPASSQNPDGSIVPGAPATYREKLKPLVINDEDQQAIPSGINAASLPSMAKAAAASIWARNAERAMGSITGAMGQVRIEGRMKEVRAYIDAAGAALIQANLPPEIDPLSMFSFMDDSTRNILLKVPV